MIFSSYTFILLFLPITIAGFVILSQMGSRRMSMNWLVLASLFFYGWWNPSYLWLISASILFNYGFGRLLSQCPKPTAKWLLWFGVSANLATIGYFKYAGFLVDNAATLTGQNWHLNQIILPLAISFFTFQQIAYLIDAYRGLCHEYRFLDYCLFVIFFPQLIAGPIIHHQEVMPQFLHKRWGMHPRMLAVGITFFIIGLSKKVLIADELAPFATSVFTHAEQVTQLGPLGFGEAWIGALAYTFQLYFDFSGYSDMAIGLAAIFGIRLPLNFHSPYKAWNIIEFWRRWHMTLSRFLRDYVYIILGGNRFGTIRRHRNIMITMLIGGLWHGADWTFVAWGGLHGAYLIVNHGWHKLKRQRQWKSQPKFHALSVLVSFIAVVFGWVLFRALTFDGAINVLKPMIGLNGWNLTLPTEQNETTPWLILALLGWVWFLPNPQQILSKYRRLDKHFRDNPQATWLPEIKWSPDAFWTILLAILTIVCFLEMSRTNDFIYYQF